MRYDIVIYRDYDGKQKVEHVRRPRPHPCIEK